MVNAFVLLSISRDQITTVAEQLADMEGVTEVYSVAGQFDLIAVVRAQDNEGVAELITNHMLRLEGIVRSETLIAFRVYSKYDLEHLFSIGMEKGTH
jgi:DNA-binding Lrp family transcriptional regulator